MNSCGVGTTLTTVCLFFAFSTMGDNFFVTQILLVAVCPRNMSHTTRYERPVDEDA
jgi:hypothetical protein